MTLGMPLANLLPRLWIPEKWWWKIGRTGCWKERSRSVWLDVFSRSLVVVGFPLKHCHWAIHGAKVEKIFCASLVWPERGKGKKRSRVKTARRQIEVMSDYQPWRENERMEPSLWGEGWCREREGGVDGGNLSSLEAGIQQWMWLAPAWCSKCLAAALSQRWFETAFKMLRMR